MPESRIVLLPILHIFRRNGIGKRSIHGLTLRAKNDHRREQEASREQNDQLEARLVLCPPTGNHFATAIAFKCDSGIANFPNAMWHFVHWKLEFAFLESISKFNAPPSSDVAVTWHAAQEVMLTLVVLGSAVLIVSTLWHVEQLSSAWLNHSCLNVPEELRRRQEVSTTLSSIPIVAGSFGSRSEGGSGNLNV